MKKKQPKIEDAVKALEHVSNQLAGIKAFVDIFLEEQENFTLIPVIVEQAKKSNKGVITASWIQRKFKKGYSRSSQILDLMLIDRLIKSDKDNPRFKFHIV